MSKLTSKMAQRSFKWFISNNSLTKYHKDNLRLTVIEMEMEIVPISNHKCSRIATELQRKQSKAATTPIIMMAAKNLHTRQKPSITIIKLLFKIKKGLW